MLKSKPFFLIYTFHVHDLISPNCSEIFFEGRQQRIRQYNNQVPSFSSHNLGTWFVATLYENSLINRGDHIPVQFLNRDSHFDLAGAEVIFFCFSRNTATLKQHTLWVAIIQNLLFINYETLN